jgi:hypothetical protein
VDLRTTERPFWIHGGLHIQEAACRSPGEPPWSVEFGGDLEFELTVEVRRRLPRWEGFIALFSVAGVEVAASQIPDSATTGMEHPGIGRLRCRLGDLRLAPGVYPINIGLRSFAGMEDFVAEAVNLQILPNAVSAALHTDAYRGFYVPKADYRPA